MLILLIIVPQPIFIPSANSIVARIIHCEERTWSSPWSLASSVSEPLEHYVRHHELDLNAVIEIPLEAATSIGLGRWETTERVREREREREWKGEREREGVEGRERERATVCAESSGTCLALDGAWLALRRVTARYDSRVLFRETGLSPFTVLVPAEVLLRCASESRSGSCTPESGSSSDSEVVRKSFALRKLVENAAAVHFS